MSRCLLRGAMIQVVALVSVLLALGVQVAACLAQESFVTCGVQHDPACRVSLRPGQKSVTVSVRPNAAYLADSTHTKVLTVVSNRCCIDTATVRLDPNGYAAIRWTATEPFDSTVTLNVVGQASGAERLDTITLVAEKKADSTIVVSRNSSRTAYAWIRNEFVPTVTRIVVESVGNRPVTQEDCERIRYSFQPLLKGEATPDSGFTVWERPPQQPFARLLSRTPPDTTSRCIAYTRWKMGDMTGLHQMEVELHGDGIKPERVELRGYGRQGVRVAAGLGLFRSIERDRDFLCRARTDDAACANEDTFPKKVTATHRADGTEAFVGLDFPVILGYSASSPIPRFLSRRLRVIAGTTLNNPEKNPFLGVTLMPLIAPAAEELPMQISVGMTINGPKRPMYGLSLDASSLAAPVLRVLGVGGG